MPSSTHPTEPADPILIRPLAPVEPLATPSRLGRGIEALVAEANDRRNQDARTRLGAMIDVERLLAGDPSSLIEFTLPVEAPRVWEAITETFHHDDVRPGRLLAEATEDSPIDYARSYGVHRPSVGAVASAVASGGTATLLGIDWVLPEIGSVVGDLESIGGRECSGGITIVGPGGQHVEPADRARDIFLVPLSPDVMCTTPPAGHAFELPLGTGLVARIGSGAIVQSPGATSLLLRIVLPVEHPWGDIVSSSASAILHPLLRADVPPSRSRPISSYAGAIYPDERRLRDELALALGRESQQRVVAATRANIPVRPNSAIGVLRSIQFNNGTDGELRFVPHAGVMLSHTDGGIVLAAAGLALTGEESVLESLAPLLDGRPVDRTEATSQLAAACGSAEAAERVVQHLWRAELVEPCA